VTTARVTARRAAGARHQVAPASHPARQATITLLVDGVPVACMDGDTVATALLGSRRWISEDGTRRRALLCGIGICFECVLAIDDRDGHRACMTRARDAMRVTTVRRPGS
jgi:D-hydroxyproline dehydrogenase subunit gamma